MLAVDDSNPSGYRWKLSRFSAALSEFTPAADDANSVKQHTTI
jgi:predicted oxidoreductase (fatty acid repression mutant protein)